jgi:hypothetical protein
LRFFDEEKRTGSFYALGFLALFTDSMREESTPFVSEAFCPSGRFFSAEELLERTLLAGGWWRVGKAGDMVGIVGGVGRFGGTTW